MRISTNMIFERGISTLQGQWADILRASEQAATGRRVLTPADDPIASARALEVDQSRAVNKQFSHNISYADDALRLLESRLEGAGDILHHVRGRAMEAGNPILSAEDLGFIATDLKAQFEAMMALANSRDGIGEYIFAGYSSQLKPFTGSVSGVSYEGDQGERSIQVSGSRYLPISLPGSDVFDRSLVLDTRTVNVHPAGANQGSGEVNISAVNAAAVHQSSRYQLRFDGSQYSIMRHGQDGTEVPPALIQAPGTGITFDGLTVDLPAPPEVAAGDAFEIWVPSTNLLNNMAMFANVLEQQNGVSGMVGAVSFALDTLDAGQENMLRARAQIGSQLTETEALQDLGSDLDIQYQAILRDLVEVDYIEAISQLTQRRTYLEAAQQSFMMVSGLSLFKYLG